MTAKQPKASRYSFDSIMAESLPEARAETLRKIGLRCIVIKGLMQADEQARLARNLKSSVVKKSANKDKARRQRNAGKSKRATGRNPKS